MNTSEMEIWGSEVVRALNELEDAMGDLGGKFFLAKRMTDFSEPSDEDKNEGVKPAKLRGYQQELEEALNRYLQLQRKVETLVSERCAPFLPSKWLGEG